MNPALISRQATTLVGMRIHTCVAANQTRELWQQFRPRCREIPAQIGADFYSVQIMPADLQWQEFTQHTQFEKWAAIPVSAVSTIPMQMQVLEIPAGLYAVFEFQGTAMQARQYIQLIYTDWLPQSDYLADARPQFDVMAANYRPDDELAREEFWIPIKPK